MSKRLLASAVASLSLTAWASAELVTTAVFTNNGTNELANPYIASANDLLNGLLPTFSEGAFNLEGTGGVGILTDGQNPPILSRQVANPTGFQFPSFATAGNTAGTRLIYTLPQATSIASINMLGGWQDGGRDQQSFSIYYAVATDPTNFILLAAVNFNPDLGIGSTNPTATQVTLSDTSGVLAANVQALRFDFGTTENGYSGYSEIDVQAVPEPGTMALLGIAAVGLGFRRRGLVGRVA